MTKAQIISRMAEEAGVTRKAATAAFNALIGSVHDALRKKDGKIRIADLGTFRVAKRKARTGVNPQTGQKLKIAATKVPRFTAANALREIAKKAK